LPSEGVVLRPEAALGRWYLAILTYFKRYTCRDSRDLCSKTAGTGSLSQETKNLKPRNQNQQNFDEETPASEPAY